MSEGQTPEQALVDALELCRRTISNYCWHHGYLDFCALLHQDDTYQAGQVWRHLLALSFALSNIDPELLGPLALLEGDEL